MRLNPARIKGTLKAPASKSISIRALLAAALAPGVSTISNLSSCDDLQSCERALSAMQVKTWEVPHALCVQGGTISLPPQIDCGESALLLRMLIPITALFIHSEVELTAQGSLLQRPVGELKQLKALGVEISSQLERAPLRVMGRLRAGEFELDASHTSQIISGLLFVLPLLTRGSKIKLSALKSKPYLALTLDLLRRFDIDWECDWERLEFSCRGGQSFRPSEVEIEGDWSAAAFWLVAAALNGEVCVQGLNPTSLQADRAILELLRVAGVSPQFSEKGIVVAKSEIKGFRFDLSESPDLFPAAVCLASGAISPSLISGVSRLKYKESDRGAALVSEFTKLGVQIALEGDLMRVHPGRLKGAKLNAHSDHRIAMACAVAALNAAAPVELEGAESVSKSYPEFFEQLALLRM